ncbi:Protein of unkown function DUF2303 [uncultured Caudovirales phage]|uniref:Protein of unkown function DUF2303 n=1 Tax=uncultured Caudovirales phage TaxID=2100421 RepID=A0A6J5LV80_9CAUD|nr:Protein of unkown function DUF2303 [uncultured Caudovirales phage]
MDAQTIDRIVSLSKTGQEIALDSEFYHPAFIDGRDIVSVEQFSKTPYDVREDRQLPSLKAFTDYLEAFKQPNTVVFADTVAQKLQAVLDYHGTPERLNERITGFAPGTPSWCKHKASFSLTQDEDFAHFLKLDKRAMEQDDLVIELTDYAPHFLVPAAADILALVGDVQLVDSKELASKVGSGGLSTLYKHDKKLQAKGQLQFPDVFKVALPVFKGFPARYELSFRLLWKCGDETRNKIMFQMRLVRPHAILEAAFQDVCKQIKDAAPGVALYGADPTLTSVA